MSGGRRGNRYPPGRASVLDFERSVLDARMEGLSTREIAARLKRSQSGVAKALTRIGSKIERSLPTDLLALRSREAGQLEIVATEAMAAWIESRDRGEADPRFLAAALAARTQIAAIHGLGKPTLVGVPVRVPTPLEAMTNAQLLDAVERELAEERQRLEPSAPAQAPLNRRPAPRPAPAPNGGPAPAQAPATATQEPSEPAPLAVATGRVLEPDAVLPAYRDALERLQDDPSIRAALEQLQAFAAPVSET